MVHPCMLVADAMAAGCQAAGFRPRVRDRCSPLLPYARALLQICCDINKPDGQYVLPPDRTAVTRFVDTLPVGVWAARHVKERKKALRGHSINEDHRAARHVRAARCCSQRMTPCQGTVQRLPLRAPCLPRWHPLRPPLADAQDPLHRQGAPAGARPAVAPASRQPHPRPSIYPEHAAPAHRGPGIAGTACNRLVLYLAARSCAVSSGP
jgi:hypothetical protein